MSIKKPTPKQIKFARLYIELGNASEAYKQAYNVTTTNKNTIKSKATNLLKNETIDMLIKDLHNKHSERHDVTVDSLTKELDEAREMARQLMDPKAMITATMGKAKIHGKDKQIIEHQGDIKNMQPVINMSFSREEE